MISGMMYGCKSCFGPDVRCIVQDQGGDPDVRCIVQNQGGG
jgi:hypothetical protein